MRELIDIVAAFEKLAAAGTPAALATVVAVSGSSYRRPGARMLVSGDGQSWGGVSGGCLERDVIRRARMLLGDEARPDAPPAVCCYETGDDGDAVSTAGSDGSTGGDADPPSLEPGPSLGCGGQIEILIETVHREKPGPLAAMISAVRNRRAAALATVIRVGDVTRSDVKLGQRVIRIESDDVAADIADPTLRSAIDQIMGESATGEQAPFQQRGLSRFPLSGGGWADLRFERVQPPQAIAIFGDGHDAGPMVELAKSMGWHVTVVGARAVAGLQQRFPQADVCIHGGADDPTGGVVPLPSGTAAIIMAHNLRRDIAVTAALLKDPPAYLGILGPLRRTARLLASSGNSPASVAPTVFAPVGLDIGAETSEQIALSVISEIQAFLAGHGGGFLRARGGPIHFRGGDEPILDSAKEILDSCGME